MKIIDQIADLLEDQGIGTVGTSIFTGELPNDGNNIVSLVSSPSPEPNKSIPYYTQNFDVWARYSDYDDGNAKLQSIFDIIHQREDFDLTDFHCYLSYAVGMIDDMGRDAERRHLFKVSFAVVYRDSSDLS